MRRRLFVVIIVIIDFHAVRLALCHLEAVGQNDGEVPDVRRGHGIFLFRFQSLFRIYFSRGGNDVVLGHGERHRKRSAFGEKGIPVRIVDAFIESAVRIAAENRKEISEIDRFLRDARAVIYFRQFGKKTNIQSDFIAGE